MNGLRVALHNPFGPVRPVAERELADRMIIAGTRKGWTVKVVHSIAQIEDFAPDLVVGLHGQAPKLTDFPTVGCLWSPPAHVESDPVAFAQALSYDGFLVAGPGMERFLRACFFPTHRPLPAAPFYPSTHETTLTPRIRADSRLFYIGSNWDGRRFEQLFGRLAEAGFLAAHGPAEGWGYLGAGYAGPLPFDGRAALEAANRCGIGLCLHLPGHTDAGLPNMRIFELAAAGALIICGRHPFIERHFGDSVLTVDADARPDALAAAITAHVRWAQERPAAANTLAARSQAIFRETFTLDRMMEGWPALLAAIRSSCGFDRTEGETVQYVLPVSGATAQALRRTIDGVAKQSHRPVSLILAGDATSLRRAKTATAEGFIAHDVVVPENELPGAALWAGLRATDAAWIGVLEPGDQLFSNHVAALLDVADRGGADLVFAHTAMEREEGWVPAPSDALRRGELPGDRVAVPPAAFLARRALLDSRLLRDPGLRVGTGALHLVRRLTAKVAAGMGAGPLSTWLTSARTGARTLSPEERREIGRLERFDPLMPVPISGPDPHRTTMAGPRPKPAPPGDMGACVLDDVPLLHEPEDFAALDPAPPIYIFGTGQGGRLVQLEVMKHPHLRIAGFLDSRAAGSAWDLPVHRPADLPPARLAAATVIVASQHVVEILTLLKGFGRLSPFNAYPYIAARTQT